MLLGILSCCCCCCSYVWIIGLLFSNNNCGCYKYTPRLYNKNHRLLVFLRLQRNRTKLSNTHDPRVIIYRTPYRTCCWYRCQQRLLSSHTSDGKTIAYLLLVLGHEKILCQQRELVVSLPIKRHSSSVGIRELLGVILCLKFELQNIYNNSNDNTK